MNFYYNFLTLCNSIKKTPSKVALEIGFSKAAVNRWKNGSLPSDAAMLKIADYFNISVDYLKGKTDPHTENDSRDNTSTLKVIAMGESEGTETVTVDNNKIEKLNKLLLVARDLSDKELDKLIKMAEILE